MATVQVMVRVFGAEARFDMADDGATVLAAAQAAGVDLPSSCEAGVCASCRARLLVGEVELISDFALDPDERAAGYVLVCQALPRSATLLLDFDA